MEAQIKLGCLQLAAELGKRNNEYLPERVVEIATVLYNFCKAPPVVEESPEIADKPKPGRKPKQLDILS